MLVLVFASILRLFVFYLLPLTFYLGFRFGRLTAYREVINCYRRHLCRIRGRAAAFGEGPVARQASRRHYCSKEKFHFLFPFGDQYCFERSVDALILAYQEAVKCRQKAKEG